MGAGNLSIDRLLILCLFCYVHIVIFVPHGYWHMVLENDRDAIEIDRCYRDRDAIEKEML